MVSRMIPAAAIVIVAAIGPVFAQEPETREEALRREREAKSKTLTPPEISGLERLLLKLENNRIFERLPTTLIKPRDKVLKTWLTGVNPIVNPKLTADGALTFENAAVTASVASPPGSCP